MTHMTCREIVEALKSHDNPLMRAIGNASTQGEWDEVFRQVREMIAEERRLSDERTKKDEH